MSNNNIIYSLADFLITPFFRWLTLLLTVILTILQYLNEPQRFSYKKLFYGASYKWHLYALAVLGTITTVFTCIGIWIQIPFTDKLPNYWYIYLFILYLAIITQITVDSKQYTDDGSFNPPPTYMYPQKYRLMLAYAGVVVDSIIMIQLYIYFGISNINRKTLFNNFFLERFGGWYPGNKLEFIFDWSGLLKIGLKLYILYLQKGFQACNYGLPLSWNA